MAPKDKWEISIEKTNTGNQIVYINSSDSEKEVVGGE